MKLSKEETWVLILAAIAIAGVFAASELIGTVDNAANDQANNAEEIISGVTQAPANLLESLFQVFGF